MNEWISTIENGLSYNGSTLHMLINYFLIAISVLPYCIESVRRTKHRAWVLALCIVSLVQVLLWFLLGVVGVSVIWCAMTGYLLIDFKRRGLKPARKNGMMLFSILMGVGGIFYYFITFPMLTTVAHVVALLIGAGLFLLLVKKEKYRLS